MANFRFMCVCGIKFIIIVLQIKKKLYPQMIVFWHNFIALTLVRNLLGFASGLLYGLSRRTAVSPAVQLTSSGGSWTGDYGGSNPPLVGLLNRTSYDTCP